MSCGRMNKIWTNSFSVSTVYDVCLRNQRPSLQTARFLVWLQTCRLLLSASLFNDTTAHSKYHPINCGEMCENTPFSILNVSHIWYRWKRCKRKICLWIASFELRLSKSMSTKRFLYDNFRRFERVQAQISVYPASFNDSCSGSHKSRRRTFLLCNGIAYSKSINLGDLLIAFNVKIELFCSRFLVAFRFFVSFVQLYFSLLLFASFAANTVHRGTRSLCRLILDGRRCCMRRARVSLNFVWTDNGRKGNEKYGTRALLPANCAISLILVEQ